MQQPLFTRQTSSSVAVYYSFNTLTQPVAVWTPSSQKSIQLTGVHLSAPLGVTVTLSTDDNQTLLALRPTQTTSSLCQAFPSACRLAKGRSIFLQTSDEETACKTFGADTATQTAYAGQSDFTNVSNAAGLADGQVASLNSALLAPTGGRIVLTYNMAIAPASQLQIESVVIKYYCRLALTLAVGVSSMILYWRPSSTASWIQLQEFSLSLVGVLNYLVTPVQQDITADVLAAPNPWDVIANLQTSFVGSHTGLGVGNIIQLDAVEIDVCVSGLNQITLCGFET